MRTSHPSDEALSAHLDGEAPEVAAHLADCDACRSRVGDLRRVAALIGTPPSPTGDDARDDAIARALADQGDDSRRRRLTLVAVAAVVVAAAGIATPLLLRGSGDERTTTALSSPQSASDRVRAGAEGKSAGLAAPFEAGDIGDQSDPAALSSLVSSALSRAADSQTASGGTAAAASGAGSSASAPAPPSTIACIAPVDGAQVVYRAELRWKGTPAQLFAIEPGRRLVVMDSARCRVLVDRHF